MQPLQKDWTLVFVSSPFTSLFQVSTLLREPAIQLIQLYTMSAVRRPHHCHFRAATIITGNTNEHNNNLNAKTHIQWKFRKRLIFHRGCQKFIPPSEISQKLPPILMRTRVILKKRHTSITSAYIMNTEHVKEPTAKWFHRMLSPSPFPTMSICASLQLPNKSIGWKFHCRGFYCF